MATYTQTTTFANGNTADGGQVNTEIVNLGSSVNSITNDQVSASAAIAETKLASGIRPRVVNRQGGSATIWTTAGTTTRTVATPVIQAGAIAMGSESTSGSFFFSTATVTFPTAFTYIPLVFGNTQSGATWVKCDPTSATTCALTVWSTATGTSGVVVNWLAIGE